MQDTQNTASGDQLRKLWDMHNGPLSKILAMNATPEDYEAYRSASMTRYLLDGNRAELDNRLLFVDTYQTMQQGVKCSDEIYSIQHILERAVRDYGEGFWVVSPQGAGSCISERLAETLIRAREAVGPRADGVPPAAPARNKRGRPAR